MKTPGSRIELHRTPQKYSEQTVEEWKSVIMIYLHKCNKINYDNYRRVSVLESKAKLYMRIIIKWIERVIENSDEQSGFCSKKIHHYNLSKADY